MASNRLESLTAAERIATKAQSEKRCMTKKRGGTLQHIYSREEIVPLALLCAREANSSDDTIQCRYLKYRIALQGAGGSVQKSAEHPEVEANC
jgi:hypothetical protein